MSDIVKSIFRRREIEKLYELGIKNQYEYNFIFKKVDETLIEVENEDKVISDKEIGRYDIEIPMLEVGDEFFLHDIQELVKIKSRTRSSDGTTIYYIDDKIVDTDNTKKSYAECREKIEYWKYEKEKNKELEEKNKELEEKLKSVNKEFDDYRNKYKYKRRFFNKKCL